MARHNLAPPEELQPMLAGTGGGVQDCAQHRPSCAGGSPMPSPRRSRRGNGLGSPVTRRTAACVACAAGDGPAAPAALAEEMDGCRGLEDLSPDVLQHVLARLCYADVAHVKRCSHRLHYSCRCAAQFWAPRVEARLGQSASAAGPTLYEQLQQHAGRQEGEHTGCDWLHVCCCIERAAMGPWHLDASLLGPEQCPHGLLLLFELTMQPPVQGEGGCRWRERESVTVLSFELDGKHVEVVVEGSGRVTSPQREWTQGAITLAPGKPLTLALEISYIFPVPAWFLHPCMPCGGGGAAAAAAATVAAAAPVEGGGAASVKYGGSTGIGGGCAAPGNGISSGSAALALDLSRGMGSYVIDPRYLDMSNHMGQTPSSYGSLTRLQLGASPHWRPSKLANLLSRLLPGCKRSSGGGGSLAAAAMPGGGGGSAGGTPGISPRGHCMAASAGSSGGGSAAAAGSSSSSTSAGGFPYTGCWARVAGGTGAHIGSGGSPAKESAAAVGSRLVGPAAAAAAFKAAPAAAAPRSPQASQQGGGHGLRVAVGCASLWQVPADPARRFTEGYMQTVEQSVLLQLLRAERLVLQE